MSIDMSQFLQTFYEESFEGLDVMETELLALDIGEADLETINTIFRAAHSIKGGSATFGLDQVASFTHVMETLLDEMRDGQRDVTQEAVNILLESVDILREMLTALQSEDEVDTVRVAAGQKNLEVLLAGESVDQNSATTENTADEVPSNETEQLNSTGEKGWVIKFKPFVDMLQTGNDPVRMLRELKALGEYSVEVDTSDLADFMMLEPENSYLAWTITLKGDIEKSEVEEVFDWVEDECDLTITELLDSTTGSANESTGQSDEVESTEAGLNIELLEETFALLAPKGEELVARFYEELFKRFPQVKPLFLGVSTEKQQTKLLAALKLVVENLRNQDVLVNALTEMGKRHQKYGVQKEHYPAVVLTLLDVMQEVAGNAWNANVEAAWKEALELVAKVMTDAYEDKAQKPETPATSIATTPENKSTGEAKPAASVKSKRKATTTETTSIRVSIDKVDELINMVGELVITQSMLSQLGEGEEFREAEIEKLKSGLIQLERNTRELQENVMRIRMLPISFVFQRFPRLVHDLSGKLNKNIELKLSGEQTELDKTVMEKIGDPLVHLVRNSLDHGIERPEERVAAGKPETGVIHLNAYHEGGNIVIEIHDDGAGLNKEKILAKGVANGVVNEGDNLTEDEINDLIFQPGFSTAEIVSDVSGRGVGMDVVRRNIRALGGTVEVKSETGKGSTFTIRLPLTLAILDGQSIVVGEENYIVPLVSIVESIQVNLSQVNGIAGQTEVYRLRDDYIPIVRLHELFGIKPLHEHMEDGLLVIVEAEGQKIALLVDDLLGQQQVVIKSLETNFRKVDGVSGATILGDGTVALILDVSGLIYISKQKNSKNPKLPQGNDGSVAA